MYLHFPSKVLPAVFFPVCSCSLLCIQEQELQRGISDSWNRNILLWLHCSLEGELWLLLRAVQSLHEKQWEHWAASTAWWRVQSALMKSPKGFKPIDSHHSGPQAPVELLSWLRCWLYTLCLCGCEDRFCLPDSWDGIEAALFPKTYQRKCYWLLEMDFSPTSDQPGPSLRCDLCLLLKF